MNDKRKYWMNEIDVFTSNTSKNPYSIRLLGLETTKDGSFLYNFSICDDYEFSVKKSTDLSKFDINFESKDDLLGSFILELNSEKFFCFTEVLEDVTKQFERTIGIDEDDREQEDLKELERLHVLTTNSNIRLYLTTLMKNYKSVKVPEIKGTKMREMKKDILGMEQEFITLQEKYNLLQYKSRVSMMDKNQDKMMIQPVLDTLGKSKNIRFFVKNEEKVLKENKIARYTLLPTNTFDLDAEQIHFRIAESQFHRYLSTFGQNGQYKIESVQYIVNPKLFKTFANAKAKLCKKHQFLDESMKPVLLWHGTSESNMENIIKTNFMLSKVGSTTDMGWYGRGIYFSEFPGTSIGYSGGNPYLLLCLVYVGKAYKMTQVQTGCELTKGYDSHISGDGHEVVIFDMDCILPCYKVKWVNSNGQQSYQQVEVGDPSYEN